MTRIEEFRELIRAADGGEPEQPDDAWVDPLRDFQKALREAGVGARVKNGSEDRRYRLQVWPLYRPAFRTDLVMLEVRQQHCLAWAGNTPERLGSPAAVTQWLKNLARRTEFAGALARLRALAGEVVDARLERENGMATLVQVTPDQQRALAEVPVGKAPDLSLQLEEGERAPDPTALVTFDAAGVRFEIVRANVQGRTVTLELFKPEQTLE